MPPPQQGFRPLGPPRPISPPAQANQAVYNSPGGMAGYAQSASTMYPPQPGAISQSPSQLVRPMSSMTTAPPQAKISAGHMPNVVAGQEADRARYGEPGAIFRTSVLNDLLPPLPTTDVPILDDGNCGPNYMRSTLYHVPVSEDLLGTTKLPMALIVQPFARPHPLQAPLPIIDFGKNGPIRCTRCRAYINLFVNFTRGGRTYECNICGMNNDVPDEYFCNLDATGRRTDLQQRPELLHGSIEFTASKEYIMRKPEAPYLIFAVDISRAAVQSGAFASSLITIRTMVEDHIRQRQQGQATPYGKMAIITFDKSISVYDLRATEPQILVMSDVHDPFVPLHDGLFFDPEVAHEQVCDLLNRLPALFNETRVVDSCLGAAAAFAFEALKGHGGRVVLFSTSIPTVGIGLLRNRDSSAPVPTDKVNPLILPQGDFYGKLGKQAASFGVSYVLVATPPGGSYIDLATVGQLTVATSGQIMHYPKFGSDLTGPALVEDVRRFLTKPFVFDTVLRVRAGSALQTGEYYGNFSTLNQTDYQFAALDCDQSFAVTFLYDSKLPENERVSFQCAILHTTSDGQRRIRVHNLALTVSAVVANIFRMADADAILQFNVKRAISQIATTGLQNLVNHFHIRSAQALGAYRKFCANTMPTGQLVLPESLKMLPIYCLAFSKSTALSTAMTHIDVRVAALFNMMSMPMPLLPIHLYPRLYPIHRLTELSTDEDFPPQLRLSHEFLEGNGIYLLENGARMLLWVGNMVDPEILVKLFGVAQLVDIRVAGNALPELNNSLSLKARQLVDRIQARYDRYLPLQLVRQSMDPTEVDWQNSLVEDAQTSLGPSYVDFLCRLHNQINHEMSSASLAEKTALLSFLQ
jgi:protein transport protein SEC24